jgi:hypothetical protein
VYRPAPAPQPEVVVAAPVVAGPVFEAPGVEVIEVEPPPVERVYVYDPGYPPGCYFYNDYYWYGGYRYPHDVFINRYVRVNVRENRFSNVEENRRQGQQIEARHRAEFAENHGVRQANRAAKPAARPAASRERDSREQPPRY